VNDYLVDSFSSSLIVSLSPCNCFNGGDESYVYGFNGEDGYDVKYFISKALPAPGLFFGSYSNNLNKNSRASFETLESGF